MFYILQKNINLSIPYAKYKIKWILYEGRGHVNTSLIYYKRNIAIRFNNGQKIVLQLHYYYDDSYQMYHVHVCVLNLKELAAMTTLEIESTE